MNCTFMNGQFADECEMCGEPLAGGKAGGRMRPASATHQRSGSNGGGGMLSSSLDRSGRSAW